MDEGALFQLPSLPQLSASNYAKGAAVEHLVIAELLRRGHKVAKPVVDDDGVDLVVDCRTRVQVKATSSVSGGFLIVHSTCGVRQAGEPFHVDVFVVADLRPSRSSLSPFYVVPTSGMRLGGSFVLTNRYNGCRGDWDLFSRVGLERAA